MLDKLPRWILNNPLPAFNDMESVTVLEAVHKLYGSMNELIEEYNKYIENMNKSWNDFESASKEDDGLFKLEMRQHFQEFIGIIELKLMDSDRLIWEIKNDIHQTVSEQLGADLESLIREVANDVIPSIVDETLVDYQNNGTIVSKTYVDAADEDLETADSSLSDRIEVFENLEWKTFGSLGAIDLTETATPTEVYNALPSHSTVYANAQVLTATEWNLPNMYGILEFTKYFAGRTKVCLWGNTGENNYIAELDSTGIPTGQWYKIGFTS